MRISRWIAATALSLAAATALAQVTAPAIAARSWLLVDITSGQTLVSNEPDLKVEPASLTKLMTAYLVFKALREKRLSLEQRPPVSRHAWKTPGSRMFVDPEHPATVDELLHGMIIQSGNDASVILAEAVAGSEDAFAQQMNLEAQRMGLKNTHFVNATGLPDPQHYSTARDLATIAERLLTDFPKEYGLYSQKEYTYNNIRQQNRNRLLFIDPSVDGVKTGFTDAAGYCLIASSHRPQPGADFQRRLLSVLLGAGSPAARSIESQKLLNFGFQNFDDTRLFAKGKPMGAWPVWKGSSSEVAAGFDSDVIVSVPKGQEKAVKAQVERVQPLIAPIALGQRIGVLRVTEGDRVLLERPVLALAAVERAGLLGRAWDTVRLWFKK